jgi:hypothetical protein
MIQAHRFLMPLPIAVFALVLFRSAVAGLGDGAGTDREAALPSFAKLKRGMTPEQVRGIMGAPRHIARQIFYHRYREQWIYDASVPIRLTFDCPRGQMPQLLLTKGLTEKSEPQP